MPTVTLTTCSICNRANVLGGRCRSERACEARAAGRRVEAALSQMPPTPTVRAVLADMEIVMEKLDDYREET